MTNGNSAKIQLQEALKPLCAVTPWMKHIIELLDDIKIPEGDLLGQFGFVRLVCNEIYKENKNFYLQPEANDLKVYTLNIIGQMEIKRSTKPFSKIVEKVAEEMKKESIYKKSSGSP